MRQADKNMVDRILTDKRMADDDDFSREFWIGGGIVAPSDVSVANGYSAMEDLDIFLQIEIHFCFPCPVF